jgi:plastocyanin
MKKLIIGGLSLVTVGFIVLLASLAAGFDQPTPSSTAPANTSSHDGHSATGPAPVSYKTGSQPMGASIVDVEIPGFSFSPSVITVPLGTTVRWTNKHNIAHTVTANGVFDSGTLNQNDVFTFTFTTPGVYDYVCAFHNNMTGKVVVEAITNVDIQEFAFVPQTITIPVGTAVRWTNKDAATHTVTSLTGAFNSGSLAQGQSFVFTFTTPGVYNYRCNPHPFMTGKVVVLADPAELTALVPDNKPVGSSEFTLQVNGSGFISDTVVTWNGTALTSGVVNSNQMTATVPANLLTAPTIASVSVTNPVYSAAPNSLLFTVTAVTCPNNPLIVTLDTDTSACGTLRRALQEAATSSSPVTVTLSLSPGSAITLISPIIIPSGTTIKATCGQNGPVVTLNGGNQPALVLANGAKLEGLNITGFAGPQVLATDGTNPVNFNCVTVTRSS